VVVDRNGAGDAFAAGVAWAIARREPAVGLALAGVAASSSAIEHRGPQAGGATRRRFDELRSQLTFEPRRPTAAS
jgi:sugar/nucleoside kinase (ribokinase family)